MQVLLTQKAKSWDRNVHQGSESASISQLLLWQLAEGPLFPCTWVVSPLQPSELLHVMSVDDLKPVGGLLKFHQIVSVIFSCLTSCQLDVLCVNRRLLPAAKTQNRLHAASGASGLLEQRLTLTWMAETQSDFAHTSSVQQVCEHVAETLLLYSTSNAVVG